MAGTLELQQYILRVILVLCLNVILLFVSFSVSGEFLRDKTLLYQDQASEMREKKGQRKEGNHDFVCGASFSWGQQNSQGVNFENAK